MRWLSRIRRRLRLIVDRAGVEREMQDEMRFHLEMEAEELARLGVAEANHAARRRFGGARRRGPSRLLDRAIARRRWRLEADRQPTVHAAPPGSHGGGPPDLESSLAAHLRTERP